LKERNKKNDVEKKKDRKKSYSVMYPELSGLELELGLEAGDEGVLLEVNV
jgi:hypothetical protein